MDRSCARRARRALLLRVALGWLIIFGAVVIGIAIGLSIGILAR